MATPSKILLDNTIKPVFATNLREDSTKLASQLLQENHENHHIFFNSEGFHNHIVHHLLTIYALGASPSEIQSAYDNNASYQRPPVAPSATDTPNFHDGETWKACLGKEKHYHAFLLFFQGEMERSNPGDVINKYLFAGDERAEDLLVRLHAGFLHPLIHLGLGLEFQQPAIIAEALAQAAVHDNWIGKMLIPAEEATKESGITEMKNSIADLVDECNRNEKLKAAAQWEDGNKVRDGVIARAKDEAIGVLSQIVVGEDEIEEKMTEMMNAALYFTACAQRPTKKPKFDFYYIHSVNSSIFFPALLGASSPLSTASKKRLLEYKIRMDVSMYVSRRSPDLHTNEVREYKGMSSGSWDGLFRQINAYSDDGHSAKLIRTIAASEQRCHGRDGDAERYRIRGGDYLNIGHMVMDSIEGLDDGHENGEPRWARSVGFDEAWNSVPDRFVAVL